MQKYLLPKSLVFKYTQRSELWRKIFKAFRAPKDFQQLQVTQLPLKSMKVLGFILKMRKAIVSRLLGQLEIPSSPFLYRSGHTPLRVCPVNALCPVNSWQLFLCPQGLVNSLLGQGVRDTHPSPFISSEGPDVHHSCNQPVGSTRGYVRNSDAPVY